MMSAASRPRPWPLYALFCAGALLLAAIAIPFFGVRCTGTRTTHCIGNLKQLGSALQMYGQDYDDHLPPAASWSEASWLYVRAPELYRCPESPKPKPGERPPGYAFNSLLDGTSLEQIAARSAAPLLFDSSVGAENAADPLTSWDPRHPEGGNVLFADGHAATLRDPPPADAGLGR